MVRQNHQWKFEYNTGLQKIDEQHQKVIFQMDDLREAIKNQKDLKTTLKVAIENLSAYCEEHFKYEEELMRDIGFTGLDAHLKLHAHFVHEVDSLKEKMNSGPGHDLYITDVILVLKNWFLNHILVEDRKYLPFA